MILSESLESEKVEELVPESITYQEEVLFAMEKQTWPEELCRNISIKMA